MTIGTNVTAYKSSCIGIMIDSTTYTGEIVKINKKSIVVKFNHILVKSGKKITHDADYTDTVKFNYWKTCSDGRILYRSEANLYGIITL